MYSLKFDSSGMKVFEDVDVSIELILKEAGIPFRMMNSNTLNLSSEQYKSLALAMDRHLSGEQILRISIVDSIATFVPEFFAGLCAENGINCIRRIAKYKKIIAPVDMTVTEDDSTVSVNYVYDDGESIPRMFLLNAQISLLSIIRKGSGLESISPVKVITEYDYTSEIDDYLGIPSALGDENVIVFKKSDLLRPFITENNNMWDYLEGELNKRLKELEIDKSFSASVRRALFDMIPSGASDADRISNELGISKRTLQRKLKDEGTSFNQQLNHARELLVRNYLKMDMSLDEIAYLVNYADSKSLSRAFRVWTGESVSEYRKKLHVL